MKKTLTGIGLVALACFAATAHAATQFSSADYYLYPADFDHDGKSDLLYVAKTPDKPSGIALADSGGSPSIGFQTWPSNYLNIPWSSGQYIAIVADFNGDGYADILLQRTTPGNHYLLLANSNSNFGTPGQILGISQAIAQTGFGIAWSVDQHHLIAGDFDGNGKADLFFQSAAPGGTNAIVLSTSSGLFDYTGGGSSNCGWAHGPSQCWADGYKGFKWSTKAANVYAANFGGDARWDLLVQTKPNFVMIDYDVPFPVPTFKAGSFGIMLARAETSCQADGSNCIFRTLDDVWNWNERGTNWSPLSTNLVIGDFNGDTFADIFVQARGAGGTNKLVLANGSGTGQVQSAIAVASNIAGYTGSNYQLMVGKFGGSSVAVLYAQSTSPGGSNFYTGNISAGGGSTFGSPLQLVPNAPAPSTAVGNTVGTAGVTSRGDATYSISLHLPQGAAGLTPKLAFAYQHSISSGLLGAGWTLTGLSAISRCPATIAQDGAANAPTLQANDQYCLDGNKLRVTSGNQGANDSQYRTELESYSLIIAHGPTNGPPDWFEVRGKDGLTYEFGGTTDSRILAQGSTTSRTWALSRIHDRANNYTSFSYESDTGAGNYRPYQIKYTGNSSLAVTPPYTITFQYAARPASDVLLGYFAGGAIREAKKMTEIDVAYGATNARRYLLGYDPASNPSNRARLATIQECSATDCLTPTSVSWQTVTSGWDTNVTTSLAANTTADKIVMLDLNGDGRLDLLFSEAPSYSAACFSLATANGSYGTKTCPSGVSMFYPPTTADRWGVLARAVFGRVMDSNGDGRQEFLQYNLSAATWQRLSLNTSGTLQATSLGFSEGSSTGEDGLYATVADVNGDGRDDFVYSNSGVTQNGIVYEDWGMFARLSTGAGFSAPTQIYVGARFNSFNNILVTRICRGFINVGDVNGDSVPDLLALAVESTSSAEINPYCAGANNGEWTLFTSSNGTFTTPWGTNPRTISGSLYSRWGSIGTRTPPIIGDFNGDGLSDIAMAPLAGGNWVVRFGTGRSATPITSNFTTSVSPSDIAHIQAVDYNADGRSDLMYGASGSWNVAVSNGDGTFASAVATSLSASTLAMSTDTGGDGLVDLASIVTSTHVIEVRKHLGSRGDIARTITDAFGNRTTFTYLPLTDPSVYTPGTDSIFPMMDLNGPHYVVSSMQSTDGVGGSYTLGYFYQHGQVHLQGRGFTGFAQRTTTDSRTGFVTEEAYNQTISSTNTNWEFVGTANRRKLKQYSGGPTLQDTVLTWQSIAPDNAANRRYPFLGVSDTSRYELGNAGTPVVTVRVDTLIDNYGNPYDITKRTTEKSTGLHAESSSSVRTYTPLANMTNDVGNWCLGQATLVQTISSHTLDYGAQITRNTSQAWDTAMCRLTDQSLEPGSGWELNTHYEYDSFNNIKTIRASGSNITTRTTEINWGTTGHLPMWVKDPLLHKTDFTWDYLHALKHTETDPNGFKTTIDYDGFGRMVHLTRPDGTGQRWSYGACAQSNNYCGDSLLRYMVQADERNTADQIVSYQYLYYDALDRIKYQESLGYSGALAVVHTLYDARGNVASKSSPYYAGGGSYRGASFTYDLLDRLVQTQRPNSDADTTINTASIAYNGLTVSKADALGRAQSFVGNAWGSVLRATDAAGNNTVYTYDSFGNGRTMTDKAGNVTTLTYNIRGFKDSSTDPDLGYWSFTYDALGEVLSQTDAKDQTTSFQYDELQRTKKRIDYGGSPTFDTDWHWDTATNGIGRLGSVTSPGGYAETYTYEPIAGRVNSRTTAAAGSSYSFNYSYDPTLGKLSGVTYPTGVSGRFGVQYEYQNGFLKLIRDANTPATIYWQAVAQDARGNVIQESFGNNQQSYVNIDETNGLINYVQTGPSGGAATQNLNYQWDRVGELSSRQDVNQGIRETFGYDALGRLTDVQRNGVTTSTMTYDDIGNIKTKSDVSASPYTYDPVRKHAVTAAGSNSYGYDANGNMNLRNGASVSWYPFNLPFTINAPGGNFSTFYYGADRTRYRQASKNGATNEDRIYIGGLFEKLTVGTTTEYRHYIVAESRLVALRTTRSTGTNDTNYVHQDHLGSTDVITNASGSVVARMSYDAWGNRRGSNWMGAPSQGDTTAINNTTHIGFTGQEEIENLGLVNMNGRVYDPLIGRFMSADPFISSPYSSQSLNRYSYVGNSPLSAVDPTGFEQSCLTSICFDLLDSYLLPPSGTAFAGTFYTFNGMHGNVIVTQIDPPPPNTLLPYSPSGPDFDTINTLIGELNRSSPRLVMGPDGNLWGVSQHMIDIATKFTQEKIPLQQTGPKPLKEHYGRMIRNDGTYLEGFDHPTDDGRLCYAASAAACQAFTDKMNKAVGSGGTKPKAIFKNGMMNVHLHPGKDPNSRLFSEFDMNAGFDLNIPIFAGNMNGDLMVFPAGMKPRTDSKGIVLCLGCAAP